MSTEGKYRTDTPDTTTEIPAAGTIVYTAPDTKWDSHAADPRMGDPPNALVDRMREQSAFVVLADQHSRKHAWVVPLHVRNSPGIAGHPSQTGMVAAAPYNPSLHHPTFAAAVEAARAVRKELSERNARAELAFMELAAALVVPYNPPSAEERPAPGVAHPPPS